MIRLVVFFRVFPPLPNAVEKPPSPIAGRPPYSALGDVAPCKSGLGRCGLRPRSGSASKLLPSSGKPPGRVRHPRLPQHRRFAGSTFRRASRFAEQAETLHPLGEELRRGVGGLALF